MRTSVKLETHTPNIDTEHTISMDFELWQSHSLAREVLSTALRSVFIHMNINGDVGPAKVPPPQKNFETVRIVPVQKPSTAETSSSSEDRPASSTWRNSATLQLPLSSVRRSDNRSHHQGGGTHQVHGNANVNGRRSQSSPPQIRRKVQKKNRPQFIPYYRRFDRRLMRSSSTGTSTEASADERELVFLPRQRSRQNFPSSNITYNSDSTESSNGTDIEKAVISPAVVPYQRARFSARNSELGTSDFPYLHTTEPQIWMTSGLFTVTRGKQKISEFVAKYWAVYTSNVRYFVDHVRTIKRPGITRHTYATTWKAGSTSRVIYFMVNVFTIAPRKPIQVFCTFPNGEKHRPETSERHFKSFLNGLYWARMQDISD